MAFSHINLYLTLLCGLQAGAINSCSLNPFLSVQNLLACLVSPPLPCAFTNRLSDAFGWHQLSMHTGKDHLEAQHRSWNWEDGNKSCRNPEEPANPVVCRCWVVHAFRGLLFPVLLFVCCGGRWHELGRRTTAKLSTPRRSLGKGRLQDTQGSSWNPDSYVTRLLLSCPAVPRAGCSFWADMSQKMWQVMEREEGCSKSSDFRDRSWWELGRDSGMQSGVTPCCATPLRASFAALIAIIFSCLLECSCWSMQCLNLHPYCSGFLILIRGCHGLCPCASGHAPRQNQPHLNYLLCFMANVLEPSCLLWISTLTPTHH